MVDEQEPSAAAAPPPSGDEPPERTVEQVEAEYKARLSGKDRAHAVEKAALEARIAALTTDQSTKEQGQMDELATLKADNERLAREAAESKAKAEQQAIEARKARYPHAAEELGDDLVGTVPEDKLSSLEARLRGSGQSDDPPILASGAQRPAGDPDKPVNEKSRDELRRDLERQAPDWLAQHS